MEDLLQPTHCARLLRALADPDRLRIVRCLWNGPKKVGEVAALLRAPIANVSHHLGVLRHAGLVEAEKQGRFVVYRLPAHVFRPGGAAQAGERLDLGCCRLEFPSKKGMRDEG
jgi:DNA-binding transcriptional ArsR family regulator